MPCLALHCMLRVWRCTLWRPAITSVPATSACCLACHRFNLAYVHLVEPRSDDQPVAAEVSARPDSLAPFRQASTLVCVP